MLPDEDDLSTRLTPKGWKVGGRDHNGEGRKEGKVLPLLLPRVRKGLLNRVFESFARTEPGDLPRRNPDLLSGLGVSAFPGLAMGYREGSKADEGDRIPFAERLCDRLREGGEGFLRRRFGDLCLVGNFAYELRFVHRILLARG